MIVFKSFPKLRLKLKIMSIDEILTSRRNLGNDL